MKVEWMPSIGKTSRYCLYECTYTRIRATCQSYKSYMWTSSICEISVAVLILTSQQVSAYALLVVHSGSLCWLLVTSSNFTIYFYFLLLLLFVFGWHSFVVLMGSWAECVLRGVSINLLKESIQVDIAAQFNFVQFLYLLFIFVWILNTKNYFCLLKFQIAAKESSWNIFIWIFFLFYFENLLNLNRNITKSPLSSTPSLIHR